MDLQTTFLSSFKTLTLYFSRLAERQLLGKLHADHIYLRNFVNSNLLKKAYAVHGEDEVPSSTHTKVSHVIHADP